MPAPVATWNSQRDVWELETMDLFSGHSDVFSETWPISGTTRAGRAYARPMWVHLTVGSVSSSSPGLLPTPKAGDMKSGRDDGFRHGGYTGQVNLAGALLPTPRTTDGNGPGVHGTGGQDLRTTVTLLPIPTAQASKHAADDRGPGTLDDSNPWSVAARINNKTHLLSSGGRTRKPSDGGNE